MNDEWELLKQDPDLYVTKEHMQSIPKKPDEPEEDDEPKVDTWEKICAAPTTDEYGKPLWEKQPRNDVPTRECGFSGITHEGESKK
jgi:hypothetical protein